jgi:phosphatidate cytidylyltransferase
MNKGPGFTAPIFGLMTLILCVLEWAWSPTPEIQNIRSVLLVLVWGVFFSMVLKWGIEGWRACPVSIRQLMGLVMMLGAWTSFSLAKALGTHFLVSVLVLVWTADVGAYFVGKALGRKKLAPILSPGKSLEGAVGGWVLVLMLGLLWVHLESPFSPESSSIFTLLWTKGPVYFVGGLTSLVVCSVLGDLFESLVKRSAGFKDSSQLLPGHGGVLDRIDALLPTVPLALCWAHWVS